MSKAKSEEINFLKKASGSEKHKTVSARVPASLYSSFQSAVDVAEKNGYELSITDVITAAMEMAIKQTRQKFGEAAFQTDLPLSDKGNASKPDAKPAQQPASSPAAGKAPEVAKK